MDSILANVFLNIQSQITTQCPEFKWVDMDLNQLEDENPPLIFPCALIDLSDISYADMGENMQMAEGIAIIKLADKPYVLPTNVYSDDHKARALEFWNREHRLNKCLHGWCTNQYFTPMNRVHAATDKRHIKLRVRILKYKISFTDDTTENVYTSIVRPNLTIDVTDPITQPS